MILVHYRKKRIWDFLVAPLPQICLNPFLNLHEEKFPRKWSRSTKTVYEFSPTVRTDVHSLVAFLISMEKLSKFPLHKLFLRKEIKISKGHKMYFPRTYQMRYKWVSTMYISALYNMLSKKYNFTLALHITYHHGHGCFVTIRVK